MSDRMTNKNMPPLKTPSIAQSALAQDQVEETPFEAVASICTVLVVGLFILTFLAQNFVIPSGSMENTLLVGDHLVVDRVTLAPPAKWMPMVYYREPRRGDVVVFHPPMDPSQVWIKRVIGLPGDHVTVRDDRVTVNGHSMPFRITGTYSDGCYEHMQIASEQAGAHEHQALLCPVPLEVTQQPPRTCSRRDARGYFCGGGPPADALAFPDPKVFDMTVPPGEYMMMGDNRDNSDDSRYWGFVTERELLGKATAIWFNWNPHQTGGPIWNRIGMKIR
jgi:signal peptidase I